MVNYRKIIAENEKAMETLAYKANPKTWPEEWAELKANDEETRHDEEKLRNRYEVFQSFYPVGSIIIATMAAIMFGLLTQRVFIGILSFLGMTCSIILLYGLYYHGLEKRIQKLKNARNEYYRKYGRKVIKELLEKYRNSDELPERPALRHDGAEQLNFAELSYGREEKDVKEESKAENVGFDLHLVGDDDETDGDTAPGIQEVSDGGEKAEEVPTEETEEETPTIWRRTGKPVQPGLPAEAELQFDGGAEAVKPDGIGAEVEQDDDNTDPDCSAEAERIEEAEASTSDGEELSEAPDNDVTEEATDSPEEKGGDAQDEEIPIFNNLDEFIAYFGR